jgi:hypothetical protein
MISQKSILLIILFITVTVVKCQNSTDETKLKIATTLENYFDLERESIHLHLDKTSFINNESIWYQGYIINRKTNKPYFTTNVFVVLYDEKGNQISEKLQYASNGVFCGKIILSPKLKSGNYYIQVYTNWMNNFSENESTTIKINVINPNEGIKNYKKINTETLDFKLNPEGKSYVLGIQNQVGIQLKDCRGNAPENAEVYLQNDKNQIVKTIKLNKFGYGKFEITPSSENLKVSFKYSDKIIEKTLPKPENLGYSLDINSFTIDGKTIVKIRTNTNTSNVMKDKKLYLTVHQDQKYSLYDFALNTTGESLLTLNNTDLFEGINTVRIIDSDLKQWAERLVYISASKESKITISKSGTAEGKINLTGQSLLQNSNLSISVLPENTKALDNNNSIIAGMLINPYLQQPIDNASYYLNNLGRIQRYELDLLLINQEKSKYEWNSLRINPPKPIYTFDIGIELKGRIDSSIEKKNNHKIKLVALKDFIMMSSDISKEGDYKFSQVLIADSTYVSLSLQKLPNFETVKTEIRPQYIGRNRKFNKQFKIDVSSYCETEVLDYITDFDIPKFSSDVIQLDAVKIETKKKKLTFQNRIGNGNLRAFKIDESVYFRDILSFIEMNGFTVIRNRGTVQILSRVRSSINGAQSTPNVYIDERQLMTFDELDMLTSDEVDEVYLDPYAIVASVNNKAGVIKIYRKKGITTNSKQKPDPNSFYIKDGFARYFGFKNVDYEMSQNEGFDNYGLIDWIPEIVHDESGQFQFKVMDFNKKKCKIIIEGMTFEGKLFHEEQLVELK